MNETDALLRFCQYYGFNPAFLSGDDPYVIQGAGENFAGPIAAIRLTEKGRFGNIVWQIFHAALLARQLGIPLIELFPFRGGPLGGQYGADGLRFRYAAEAVPRHPTLVGHFFNSYPFQSALTGFPISLATKTADQDLRLLFGHLLGAVAPRPATLVVNMRGGDVFRGPTLPAWYLQPPASYYICAALHSRRRASVERVLIISEDRSNLALPGVETALRAAGFGVDFQSASFEEDLGELLRAEHLVSPNGTLCEAVAMLSKNLRTYYAFRQFESHRHQHPRRPAVLVKLLQGHGVRTIRIADPARDYTAPRSWNGDHAQIANMRNFPIERLAVEDIRAGGDPTDDKFEVFPRDKLPSSSEEAYALRQALLRLQRVSSRMKDERNALALELARPYRHPWRPLKRLLGYSALSALSALSAPFSSGMAARFHRSAKKRRPDRFDQLLSDTSAVTPKE